MAVFFWYLVNSEYSVRYCTVAILDELRFQGTRKIRPCLTGHPVQGLVFLNVCTFLIPFSE